MAVKLVLRRWVDVMIEGWRVSYHVFASADDRVPKIAEIRVYPPANGHVEAVQKRAWNEELRDVPERGVPSTVIRKISVKDAVRRFDGLVSGDVAEFFQVAPPGIKLSPYFE